MGADVYVFRKYWENRSTVHLVNYMHGKWINILHIMNILFVNFREIQRSTCWQSENCEKNVNKKRHWSNFSELCAHKMYQCSFILYARFCVILCYRNRDIPITKFLEKRNTSSTCSAMCTKKNQQKCLLKWN